MILRLQRLGEGNERDDDDCSAGSQKISQLESCFFLVDCEESGEGSRRKVHCPVSTPWARTGKLEENI